MAVRYRHNVAGDVNGDGDVTGSDVTALYNHILFGVDTTPIFNGDQNGDGEITGSDVTAVYNIILGLSTSNAPATSRAQENNGVKLSPMPASDYIVASARGYIQGVELYDMSGNLVSRNGGNYVNVSGIKAGAYILKVYTTASVTTHKVAVKH